jgi:hypothetical protein
MNRKRTISKENVYPIHTEYRQIHNVLRDSEGFIVLPDLILDRLIFLKTNYKDVKWVFPNKNGHRILRGESNINFLLCNVVDYNFTGELFKYCEHEIEQKLRPISDFTTNKTSKLTIFKIDDFGTPVALQSFCKDSKSKYTNGGPAGNGSRTKDQYLEDTGSRFRSRIIECVEHKSKIDYNQIYEKYKGGCFKCGIPVRYDSTNNGVVSNLDHTLPHSLYYSYNTTNSTLLCVDCNQSKKGKWPNEFYNNEELIKLSNLTNIPFELLNGPKKYNSNILLKVDQNFEFVVNEIEKRFRKRNDENKIKIFKKLKTDMVKFYSIQPEFNELAKSLINKINEHLKNIYYSYEY